MIELSQKFKSHPIGQGFFYSGTLKNKRVQGAEYNFIFDCGSLSRGVLNPTIDRFRSIDSNDTKDLDLLVISHFDADHVNGLKRLLDGRTVKKIIAPFINFTQRVCIALNYMGGFEADDVPDPDLDATLNAILDITNVLRENLEGSELILVTSGSGKTPEEGDYQNLDDPDNQNFDLFTFNLPNTEDLDDGELENVNFSGIPNGNVKKASCDNVAVISGGNFKILDLIFYRKSVGKNDQDFFDKVYELFLDEYNLNNHSSVQDLCDKIKGIKGATNIKKLFGQAAKEVAIDLNAREIQNMNTTTLCMLQWDKISSDITRRLRNPNNSWDIRRLEKLLDIWGYIGLTTVFGTMETKLPINNYGFHYYRNGWYQGPNTLLTADSFLKEPADVDAFINHYQNYLDRLLLFQVPHHGSKHSSEKYLFAQLPPCYNFINYGVNHSFIKSWSHPHNETILNLVATGHGGKVLAVHEYSGIETDYNIHLH